MLKDKVVEYFTNQGWEINFPDTIRGIRPDVMASKNGKLVLVEVKGSKGSIEMGIKQALHMKNVANYAYLALPRFRIPKETISICKNLGLGLLGIGKTVTELVKPAETEALESVKSRVFKKEKKQAEISLKTSLERLFKSRYTILILKLFFLNAAKTFYHNEIARKIGASTSTVSKELEILHSLGIITKSKKGNMSLYQINKEGIIYDELRKIFLKYELFDEIISRELDRFDINFALIFGSFAKGTENENSDIDLLIIGSIPEEHVLESVSNLEDKTGREINFVRWTQEEFYQKTKEKSSLLQNIQKNPKIMVIGNEEEFTRVTR